MSLSANFPAMRPTLLLNFARAAQLDPRITFTRASSGTRTNSAGTLVSMANNQPRFDYNPTTLESLGLLIEEQRTNSIRNNTMVGAVAGSPGSAPTSWSAPTTTNGLAREIVGFGTQLGISYIDVRYSGTTTASSSVIIQPEGTTSVVAATGQSWSASSWLALVGGSLLGTTAVIQRVTGRSLVGGFLEAVDTTVTLTSTISRYAASRTMVNASTERVTNDIAILYGNGEAVDFTLRIGMPQLELGAFATSVIPTTTAAATRAADNASMTGTNFSSWYNAVEGTLYAKWLSGDDLLITRPVVIDDGTANEYIAVIGSSGGGVGPYFAVVDGGVAQANIPSGGAYAAQTLYAVAGAYKADDFAASRDGAAASTDASGTVPTVTTLRVGKDSSVSALNGWVQEIIYYPTRLPNATLQALTS